MIRSMQNDNDTPELGQVNRRWTGLIQFGSIAALLIALLLVGEIFVYALIPDRNTATEIFALFSKSPLAGLLLFDLLGMISYLLYIPLILSLYILLRRSNESIMAVATVLFFIGVTVFFANNTGFSVLTLSHRFDVAQTDGEREILLAACQAMMTLFDVNAFMISYVIVSAAWTLISFVMLRSALFGKLTAWAGIAGGMSGIIAEILENTSKAFLNVAIGFYFIAIVFLIVWVLMLGKKLKTAALVMKNSIV